MEKELNPTKKSGKAVNETNVSSGHGSQSAKTAGSQNSTPSTATKNSAKAAKSVTENSGAKASTSSTTTAKTGKSKAKKPNNSASGQTDSVMGMKNMNDQLQKLTDAVAKQQQQQTLLQNMMLQFMQHQVDDQEADETELQASSEDEDASRPDHNDHVDDNQDNEKIPTNNNPGKSSPSTTTGFARRYTVGEELGVAIPSDTADALSTLLVQDMDSDRKEPVFKNHVTPVNCENLMVTKVNLPIWENLSPMTRSRDVKIQNAMKPLIKGLTAVAKSTPEPSTEQEEGMALLANAVYELRMLRRELIKPELNKKFKQLCKPEVKPTKWLFGDDLAKKVKDLDEQHKAAGGLVAYKGRPNKFNRQSVAPYPQGGQGWKGKKKRQNSTFPNPYLAKNLIQQLLNSTQQPQRAPGNFKAQNRFHAKNQDVKKQGLEK